MHITKTYQKRLDTLLEDHLEVWIEAFLIDRKVQNFSLGTTNFYLAKLQVFSRFCETQLITRISELTPDIIRMYLLWVEDAGHNPGGIHALYRALKTFLRWYWDETEQQTRNPISRVKAPKIAVSPLEPADEESISAILKTCKKDWHGLRDQAIILMLLDTGARAVELVSLNLDDIDLVSGSVFIRQGKGRKPRTVFVGQTARRALRAYLRNRQDDNPAIWISDSGERLTYWGLREIIRRRSAQAKVKPPTLHSFRRAFALSMLRAKTDIYVLQELMGHADLQVLRRYLKFQTDDLRKAHNQASPVDHLKKNNQRVLAA